MRILGKDLAHIHFADVDRSALGDGKVDWLGVMQALKDIDFAGHLTMEIGFHTRTADPDHLARHALSHLKGIEKQLA